LIKFPSLIAGSTTPQFGRYRKPCSGVKNAIFNVIDPEDGTAGSSQMSPYIYEIHAITYQKTVTVIAVRRPNPIKITFICSFLHTSSLFYAPAAFMRKRA
jgi:hypothetical protein